MAKKPTKKRIKSPIELSKEEIDAIKNKKSYKFKKPSKTEDEKNLSSSIDLVKKIYKHGGVIIAFCGQFEPGKGNHTQVMFRNSGMQALIHTLIQGTRDVSNRKTEEEHFEWLLKELKRGIEEVRGGVSIKVDSDIDKNELLKKIKDAIRKALKDKDEETDD